MKKEKLIRFGMLLIMLVLLVLSAYAVSYADTDTGSRIIVSLGDSYSAGEGIEPFFDQDMPEIEKELSSDDWAAHRSKLCWSGQLELNGIKMSEHRNENWFFVAATGAKTCDFEDSQIITIERFTDTKFSLAPQLRVFDQLPEGKKADYVTLTIGGNDAEFVDIVSSSAKTFLFINPNGLYDKVKEVWKKFEAEGGIADDLESAYRAVAARAGNQAEIIVVGYPQLFSPLGNLSIFSVWEAKYINEQVAEFNKRIEEIVGKCEDGDENHEPINIHFVSVEDAFAGHGAYTPDPYINQVMPVQYEDHKWVKPFSLEFNPISAYSMHPNKKGAQVYAKCVQDEIDWLEDEKREKAASTPEPASVTVSISDLLTGMVPDTVPEEQYVHFGYRDWYCCLLPDGTAEITGSGFYERGSISIPTEVARGPEKVKVTSIGYGAFKDRENIYAVIIPDGITTIKGKAFASTGSYFEPGTYGLDVTIPDSVTFIAEDAFDHDNSELVIKANPDSYAREYCEKYGIRCE